LLMPAQAQSSKTAESSSCTWKPQRRKLIMNYRVILRRQLVFCIQIYQ
jgi:hypothetical protein